MTTTFAWMAYGLVISGLLTLTALLAERAARNAGRPARGWWLAALAGSLLVPLVAWLWPEAPPSAEPVAAFVPRLPALTIEPGVSPGIGAAGLLVPVWATLSVTVLALLALAVLRLRRLRRDWREAEVDGERVLLSADIGPAVVGLRRARIVMPTWVLGIDRELRRLLLLHEREHMRAHDPQLLLAGLILVAVLPWNPFVWVQFLRLRLAIEVDCDARVLRTSRDARGYGALLLEVGRQRSGGAALALAFGEPRSFLEQRIRMLPRALGRRRLARAGVFALAAAAVLLLAVCARDPMSSVNPVERAGVIESDAATAEQDLMAAPTFTPFTHRPELANREAVSQALADHYPPLLREAGIGGEALVWFLIAKDGSVARTLINRSSGYPALDSAALNVAGTMRFTPARNGEVPVPVWVAIPIVFSTGDAGAQGTLRMRREATSADTVGGRGERGEDALDRMHARRATVGEIPGTRAELESGPAFTPFDQRPIVGNRDEVAAALAASYPPLLQDAGIGGTTTIWLLIEATGDVAKLQVETSSGYDALDRAALEVASQMRFTPALLKGEPVPVWVAIPIVFSP